MNWYESNENLFELAQAIEEQGNTISSGFIEKPWHWQKEWDYLQKHKTLEGFS